MKYSKEFKLECIKKYKNGEYVKDPPGVKHNTFRDQLRRWCRIYESTGEIGLDHKRSTIPIKDRIELFNRVENGESYQNVAFSMGIGASLLIKWHKIYRQNGIEGLKSLKRGKPKMIKNVIEKKSLDQMTDKEKIKYLQEKLEYLEAENAYLKKLKALVQSKQDRQRKSE